MNSDVCLILEGTYPYVSGGVSSWVYQLIRELKDVRFSIVYIGAYRDSTRTLHYELPSNIVEFRELYLFDYRVFPEKLPPARSEDFEIVKKFLMALKKGHCQHFDDLVRVAGDKETRTISLYDMAHSQALWKVLESTYREEGAEVSFVDYFWTWRFLHLPLFSILRAEIPQARVYHTVSTGYAGVLGALAASRTSRPLLLTEHGIYTRERKIEIARANWIYSESAETPAVSEGQDYFKDWWTQFFVGLSRLVYDRASEIITLYERNREIQIQEGADPARTRIISNGVSIPPALPPRNPDKKNLRIGFVGRVVPIKDVKTFIRACRKIYEEFPEVEIDILGPTDEDPDYYHECVLLTELQGLNSVIRFRGKVNPADFYPGYDVVVLTSISEAQPLVILEAHSYGIPVVSTAAGSCNELLNGRSDDDRLLGPSGLITPICDPAATAEAVIRLLKDPRKAQRMGETGRRRIVTYYQEDDFLAAYEELYNHYGERISWQA